VAAGDEPVPLSEQFYIGGAALRVREPVPRPPRRPGAQQVRLRSPRDGFPPSSTPANPPKPRADGTIRIDGTGLTGTLGVRVSKVGGSTLSFARATESRSVPRRCVLLGKL
jgi:hypothetical protein